MGRRWSDAGSETGHYHIVRDLNGTAAEPIQHRHSQSLENSYNGSRGYAEAGNKILDGRDQP